VPFYILGDTLKNREFARHFPAPIVLGFEEHIRGTLMEYVTSLGHVAIAIEGGQHDAPSSRRCHEAAVWLALVDVGCVAPGDVPDLAEHRVRLASRDGSLPGVIEIFHRHRLQGDEGFRMDDGYENFRHVQRGQRLAADRHGEVRAPFDGLLFLPLYQKRGDDGFFLARGVNPIWLYVSALLRRLGIPRLVTFLPGVRMHPNRKDTLVVNLRVARFFADKIFHLLGYRVDRRIAGRMLVRRRPGG
jgi:succinylglutamate desuccinylase